MVGLHYLIKAVEFVLATLLLYFNEEKVATEFKDNCNMLSGKCTFCSLQIHRSAGNDIHFHQFRCSI